MGTPGTGRILGPEILVFSRNFAQTHHICTHHLGINQSGWIILINSEILLMIGLVWPA